MKQKKALGSIKDDELKHSKISRLKSTKLVKIGKIWIKRLAKNKILIFTYLPNVQNLSKQKISTKSISNLFVK